MFSSPGGQNCIIQHLVSSQSVGGRSVHRLREEILFYNKFIICLYMFRALCAHHQVVEIVLYSIRYHHTH